MAETCYSCQIFDVFNQKTLSFCQAFFEAVTPELKSLLAYLFLLWIIYRLCESLIGREQNLQGLIKEFIDLSIATALLQSFQYWSGICFWIYNFGMELGIRILRITSEGQAVLKTTSGTEALLTYVESAFTPVLDKIGVMMSDVSWTSLKLAIAIIPVAIIYFLLLWRIFASLFNVFVQLFAITLLAPVLCAFYALPPFQRASYTAIRILLTNSLQIVLSCGTIGIILTYLNSLNLFQDNSVAVTVGTVGYMQMLFTGALLWGAYGIIIGTPSQILNVGNVNDANPVLTFIGHLPNKAVSLAKGHIPFGKK